MESKAEPAAEHPKVCAVCSQAPVRLQRCSLCKRVQYCSVKCQRKDWAGHKAQCARWRGKPPSSEASASGRKTHKGGAVPFSFVLELLPNVRAFQLFVELPSASSQLVLNVGMDHIVLVPPRQGPSAGQRVVLPQPVNREALHTSRHGRFLCTRLPLSPGAKPKPEDLFDEKDFFPLAIEFKMDSYDHVSCRSCRATFREGAPERVFPLPSPYWQELTDLWFCHIPDKRSAALSRMEISACPKRIFVGETYVLCFRSEFLPKCLEFVEGRVLCSKCKTVVGTCDNVGGPTGSEKLGEDVQLFKYAVYAGPGLAKRMASVSLEEKQGRGPGNVLGLYTSENFLAESMVSAVQARMDYHFVVRAFEPDGPCISLFLLSWQVKLQKSGLQDREVPAVKVLFRHYPKSSLALDSWQAKHSATVIQLSAPQVAAIVECLRASASMYPPEVRVMRGEPVGLLRRLSQASPGKGLE